MSGPPRAVGPPAGCFSPEGQALGMDSASWLPLTEPPLCGHSPGFVRVSRPRTAAPTWGAPQYTVGSPQPLNDFTAIRLLYCSNWLKGPREMGDPYNGWWVLKGNVHCPGQVAQLVGAPSRTPKVETFLPIQGTYLGCGFNSHLGHVWEATDRCLSLSLSLSLSPPCPSLKSISISSSKNLKEERKETHCRRPERGSCLI